MSARPAVVDDTALAVDPQVSRQLGRPQRASVLPPLILLAAVVGLWHLSISVGWVNEFVVPYPWDVLTGVVGLFVDVVTGGPAAVHFFTTLNEIVVGFLLGSLIGLAIGAAMSASSLISGAIYPYVIAMNSTPKVAFAPLFVAWFGFGQLPKIVLIILISAFPVIINSIAGFKAVDEPKMRLMDSLGASRVETFRRVRLQVALPYVFAGLELAIMAASIGAVVGEFTGGNRGLGYIAALAQDTVNVRTTFSTVVVLALQGIVLHRLIVILRNRVIFWDNNL
jgi:NitT/TauT family transport system permease protein